MNRLLAIVAAIILAGNGYGGTLVQFRTSVGDMAVELFDKEKPATVQNFLRYVTNGAYQDCLFHRGIGNFVIQGGGYRVQNREDRTNFIVRSISTFPPITNEFGLGQVISNSYGTIAMAKTSNPDSATSQFFFNLVRNPGLDDTNNSGGFTVFGRVIEGTNVLNRLNASHPTSQIAIVNAGTALPQLPVIKTFAGPTLESDEFIYVDVTALSVKIERVAGSQKISWNSVSNMLNIVEYSTNSPPSWHSLTTINGNGARLEFLDQENGNPWRFYRVRVANQ